MLVKKDVIIQRPSIEVFNYISDFSQLYEWDDNVSQGERVDLGPIETGSKFRFLYRFAGRSQELEYTLDQMETNKFLRFTCETSSFRAVDEITITTIDKGRTKVTYQANIEIRNALFDRLLLKKLAIASSHDSEKFWRPRKICTLQAHH